MAARLATLFAVGAGEAATRLSHWVARFNNAGWLEEGSVMEQVACFTIDCCNL